MINQKKKQMQTHFFYFYTKHSIHINNTTSFAFENRNQTERKDVYGVR